MFCTQCGEKCPKDAKFCPSCGHPIKREPAIDEELPVVQASTELVEVEEDPVSEDTSQKIKEAEEKIEATEEEVEETVEETVENVSTKIRESATETFENLQEKIDELPKEEAPKTIISKFGAVMGVLFVILALFELAGLGSSLLRLLDNFFRFRDLFLVITQLTKLISVVFMTFMMFNVYKKWNDETRRNLFAGSLFASIFILVAFLLNGLSRSIGYSFQPGSPNRIGVALSLSILAVAGLFALSYQYEKVNLLEGFKFDDMDQLKAQLTVVVEELVVTMTSTFQEVRQKQQGKKHRMSQQNIQSVQSPKRDNNMYNGYGQNLGLPHPGDSLLVTNRSIWKYILFTILTFGIYDLFMIGNIAKEVNKTCEGDGFKTRGWFIYGILTLLTCGIYSIYWKYRIAERLDQNSYRYNVRIPHKGSTIMLWEVLGFLTLAITHFVALHLLIEDVNIMNHAYNTQVMGQSN